MLRTIMVGSCVAIQGQIVRSLPDGRVEIRVDDRVFTGVPVPQTRSGIALPAAR